MKIKMIDIEAFVKHAKLPIVTSSDLVAAGGTIDEEGLLSHEIFGLPGTEERKTSYGAIELHDKAWFLHPAAYEAVYAIQQNLKGLLDGTEEYYFQHKEFHPVKDLNLATDIPTGYGINFLKKHFEESLWISGSNKVVFPEGVSPMRKDKIEFLRHNKDAIFIKHYLIIPAFYRDSEAGQVNEINVMYRNLINKCVMLREHFITFGFSEKDEFSPAYGQINALLVDIYKYFLNPFKSKQFVEKNVLGRDIDFGARSIISAATFNVKDLDRATTNFRTIAVPMHTTISLFSPFIVRGVKEFIDNYVKGERFVMDAKTGKMVELAPNYLDDFTKDKIIGYIKLYYNALYFRIEDIKLKTVDGEALMVNTISPEAMRYSYNYEGGEVESKKMVNNKQLTTLKWVELFYYLCNRDLKDKHILITRYPVTDPSSCIPFRFNTIPAIDNKTEYVYFDDENKKVMIDRN